MTTKSKDEEMYLRELDLICYALQRLNKSADMDDDVRYCAGLLREKIVKDTWIPDDNPSPEVMALVEALKFYSQLSVIPLEDIVKAMNAHSTTFDVFQEYTRRAREALSNFQKSRGG